MPSPSGKPIPRPKARAGLGFRPSRGTAVALFVLIVGLGMPLLVLPLARNFQNDGPYDAAGRERRRDALSENLDRLVAARSSYEKISRELDQKLRLAIPADPDAAGIIVTLDGLAKSSGMQLVSIDIAPRKDPIASIPGVLPVDIGITVSGGDYPRLKAFLGSVERNLRLMDVLGLTFSPRTASYALSIRTYSRQTQR